MQQLQYELSWDKALSTKDRQQIEHIFHETLQQPTSDTLCSPIRTAVNHQQALLVTVLIHNFTTKPLTFSNRQVVYRTQQQVLAEHVFTIPALVIPPQVSIPWTFIFPKNHWIAQTHTGNAYLIF